jgi:hypothetical protein
MTAYTIRSYTPSDRSGVRAIYGDDEFARPGLLRRYPRMAGYLADELSYSTDYEPESLFVAEVQGQIVGALGLAFYQKLGLEFLGQFDWLLHDGRQWLAVTERIFGLRLDKGGME